MDLGHRMRSFRWEEKMNMFEVPRYKILSVSYSTRKVSETIRSLHRPYIASTADPTCSNITEVPRRDKHVYHECDVDCYPSRVTLAVSCRPVKPASLPFSFRHISNPQLAIHELTNGMIAAAPKCGNANPIPACFIVTSPSTTPSTANIVAISETALTSPRCKKIAAMIPKVRLRPPTH